MSQNKTIATDAPVRAFIDSVDKEQRRRDSLEMLEIMEKITGQKPRLWGNSLIGFGSYHYRYESGREGDFFLTGFSPRKSALAVYIMTGFSDYSKELEKLGPHKTGKSCLYLKNLDSIDLEVLENMIRHSVGEMRRKYPAS